MLVTVDIDQKILGSKQLFAKLHFNIEDNEKLAIIGRNGVGKTTLFRMLTGKDTDYSGNITTRHGVHLIATQQEHHDLGGHTVLSYVLDHLPEYTTLKRIIDTYPSIMGDNIRKITTYSDALDRFSQLGFYTVVDRICRTLEDYQLLADSPMADLSGGQKRLVELVIIEHSHANLTLIDEPTNHMDYVAKKAFIDWFTTAKHAVTVITHDRDVLQHVSRIIEIKDRAATSFPGNYDAYLRQNAHQTSNSLNEYETAQRRIANIKKQIQYARSKKSSWGGTADKKNPFVVMEKRLLKELTDIETTARPSFWIDRESISTLRPKIGESYQKYRDKSIHIRRYNQDERKRELLKLDDVQVGYYSPLFTRFSYRISTGDRLHIIGRNGIGKTTLIRTVIEVAAGHNPSTLISGTITTDTKLRINTYEQEMNDQLLDLTLAQAIEFLYGLYDIHPSNEKVMRTMSEYLFDPLVDREQLVRNLSGGQKARLQLIKMFANDPNLLILDEPTNHLDLPSIEELEAALTSYRGALIYISHDSYLTKQLGGETATLIPFPTDQ